MRKFLTVLSVSALLALPTSTGLATGFHHGHYGGHFNHGKICHRVVVWVPKWTWVSWGGWRHGRHHNGGRHGYVRYVKVITIVCRPPVSW